MANEAEARKLIQEAMKDHPTRQFYDGPRLNRHCPSAREAMELLRKDAEKSDKRQMQVHMDGSIW